MYDTNAVNAVTRAMRSEVSDHVTASEKKSLREVRVLTELILGFLTSRELSERKLSYLVFRTFFLNCLPLFVQHLSSHHLD